MENWKINEKKFFNLWNFHTRVGVDPMQTVFTVTNRSRYVISKKHEIICYTRTAVSGNNFILQGFSTFNSNGNMAILQQHKMPPPFESYHQIANSTLEPGGDAQSDQCLIFNFQAGTVCADVTIGFLYALDNQPDLQQEKDIRYFVRRDSSGYKWIQEPVNNKKTDYCYQYLPHNSPVMPPS